ncbi:unnamed protein product, partial [Pleuronectes platessa]
MQTTCGAGQITQNASRFSSSSSSSSSSPYAPASVIRESLRVGTPPPPPLAPLSVTFHTCQGCRDPCLRTGVPCLDFGSPRKGGRSGRRGKGLGVVVRIKGLPGWLRSDVGVTPLAIGRAHLGVDGTCTAPTSPPPHTPQRPPSLAAAGAPLLSLSQYCRRQRWKGKWSKSGRYMPGRATLNRERAPPSDASSSGFKMRYSPRATLKWSWFFTVDLGSRNGGLGEEEEEERRRERRERRREKRGRREEEKSESVVFKARFHWRWPGSAHAS